MPTTERPARRAQLRARRDWYRIQNAASDEADVYIYDEISWWGVSADQFTRDLRAITAGRINLHLNSPGGSAFDGVAIYNSLRQHPASVAVHVDGIAASAASVIAMAGDQVVMHRGTTMMVHEGWALTIGNVADHQQTINMLETVNGQIASIYAARAGTSIDEWLAVMAAETWYGPQEAVDAGLADATDDTESDNTAENRFDLTVFRHPPAALVGNAKSAAHEPTKRELEQALRDAGLTSAAAKAFIARGWSDDPERDAAVERLLVGLRQLAA